MDDLLVELQEFTALCKSLNAKLKAFMREGREPRYVVRADTDLGPVYLRSLTGSLTEWTSELRYAHRFSQEEAREHQENAFCPDATSISVRPLRPRGSR